MTVAPDATHSLDTHPSGIAVYFSRVIQSMARLAPEEIVVEGETGLLVGNHASEVGAALEKLLAERELAAGMGRRARQLIEARATDDIMAEASERVYLEALRSRS